MQIGEYEVVEELGRGGAGVVYRARSKSRQRDVALKMLTGASSPRRQERFRREGRSLARLEHPNIVGIHEFGESQAGSFLVMEFVEGESLDHRLARRGALRPEHAAELFAELARALEHAHARGILHRDLKPANVILSTAGRPLLTDFGLAQDLDSREERLTIEGALTGTPGFWSPEQARGDRDAIGPHTDVYGLGAALYAALTGVAPHTGDSLAELAVAVQSKDPLAPSKLSPAVSPALDAMCLRCLEKDPGARFPSAASLAEALEGVIAVHGGPAPRSGRAALIAAVCLLGGVGAAAALWPRGPAEEAAPSAPSAPPVAPVEPVEPVDQVGALVERGTELFLADDFEGARAAFVAALRLQPEHALAQYGVGKVCVEEGDLRAAIAWFTRCLDVDPELGRAYAARGAAYVDLGESEAAKRDLRRAIDLDIGEGANHFNLGMVLDAEGDPAGAEASYTRAIELYGHDVEGSDAYLARAALYWRRRDYTRAEQDLNTALDLAPSNASSLYYLGMCQRDTKRWRLARQSFRDCLELLPEGDPRRAKVAEQLRRLQEILESEEGAELDEQQLLRRVQGLIEAERAEEALSLIRTLLARRPLEASFHNLEGTQLAGLGRYPQALEAFERAYALTPKPRYR